MAEEKLTDEEVRELIDEEGSEEGAEHIEQSEEETAEENYEQEAPEGEEEQAPKPKQVPLKAMQAERRKRQFFQKQVEELRKQNEELMTKLQSLNQMGIQPQQNYAQSQGQDPLKEVLQPYIQPEIQRLKQDIQAMLIDNQDKMDFLLKHPDIDPETYEQVEQLRMEVWQKKRIALPREDAYFYWLGLTQTQRNQLKEAAQSQSKAKQKTMNVGAKVGTSTATPPPANAPKPVEELSTEQLEKLLSDKTF